MPKTVLEAISALEEDEQFGFKGLPMPYDLNINARGARTKEVVYNVLPGKPGQLTPAELEEFKSKKPLDEVVARLLENQNVSEVGQGSPDMSYQKDEDVPVPPEPPPAPKRACEQPHKQLPA